MQAGSVSRATHAPATLTTRIHELLAEQDHLTAVERFSQSHDEGTGVSAARYEERWPSQWSPHPGQQLAFRVDLDACTGCKACVTACHSLNGLAPDETWRTVGLLVGEGVQQTVTTACHHCEDPACLAGCPVSAYEKDPRTGIVHHLDDQCIGCRYCVLKCPYDVPKYHDDLGIVRKCDMCAGRLAAGEAPACVQGCPNGAISIAVVDVHPDSALPSLLPSAGGSIPDSSYTRPTTSYVSKRGLGDLQPADTARVAPSEAHDPLAVMLVLLELSVGALLTALLSRAAGYPMPALRPILLLAAGGALLGLATATLHLGRPMYAFRAVLGWRTSWMSRETIAFGAYTAAVVLGSMSPGPSIALAIAALAIGLAGTWCSVMIYADTHRAGWALGRTVPTFGLTLVGLGALGAGTMALTGPFAGGPSQLTALPVLVPLGLAVLAAKASVELLAVRHAPTHGPPAWTRTIRLLRGPLRRRFRTRMGLAASSLVVGGVACLLPISASSGPLVLLSLVGLTCAEIVERHLYFTAEASPGMPGG